MTATKLSVTEAEQLLRAGDDELVVTSLFRRLARRGAARQMRLAMYPRTHGSLGEFVAARRQWERGLDGWLDELRADHLESFRESLAKFIERGRNPVTEADTAAAAARAQIPVTREQVLASWNPGGSCGICGKMLEPDEPVTVAFVGVPKGRWDTTDVRCVVCETCFTDRRVGTIYGLDEWGVVTAYSKRKHYRAPVPILGDVWCWEDEIESDRKYNRCHYLAKGRGEGMYLKHSFRWSDAYPYILHAPCEGCGRRVRTATRYSRKVGTQQRRRRVPDYERLAAAVGGTEPPTKKIRYEIVDEPIHEWFTACSARCVTDVRRPAARRAGPAICNTCGEPFDAKRPDALYHSDACRQKAYRERKSAKL